MERLVNKRVLVGITGGIAAYKGAELVRRLKEAGAEVRVAMTGAATQFITQLTLQTLSGRPVHLDLLDPMEEAAMGHITLARRAYVIVVAPPNADFTAAAAAQKIKKLGAHLSLELSRTDDIVAAVAAASPRPYTVAFAAETEDLLARARQKLVAKRLDLVAANWVGQAGMGFVSDDNALTLVWTDGSVEWPLASKTDLARRLISFIAERYRGQHASEN